MKKVLVSLLLVFIILFNSCTSINQRKDVPDLQEPPGFFINPPSSDKIIYGIGYGHQSSDKLSKRIAEMNALSDISSKVENWIESYIPYQQYECLDVDYELREMIENLFRKLSDEYSRHIKIIQIEQNNEGEVWMLEELNKKTIAPYIITVLMNNRVDSNYAAVFDSIHYGLNDYIEEN